MGKKTKYFMFNNHLQFQRCLLENLKYEDDRLRMEPSKGAQTGILISRVLDSQQTDMEWHQMECSVENEGNVAHNIFIYAANTLTREIGGKEENIEHILLDSGISWKRKKEIFQPYLQKEGKDMSDLLLHDVRGRYLWFVVEIYSQMEQSIAIEKIKISFPRQSWNRYLPEIYQSKDENMFFERFLAVFQTMYESLNDYIDRMPYQLDLDAADEDILQWLAKWLDINEGYMWSKEQMRTLLKHGIEWYMIRGTREAVLAFAKLYTGNDDVYLVENFQQKICDDAERQKVLLDLYGNDAYKFQVIVREEDVPTSREYRTLVKIIEEVKPAIMELELVVLKPYMFLGQHIYLGINSQLSEYKNVTLNGTSMVSFTVLSDGNVVLG